MLKTLPRLSEGVTAALSSDPDKVFGHSIIHNLSFFHYIALIINDNQGHDVTRFT